MIAYKLTKETLGKPVGTLVKLIAEDGSDMPLCKVLKKKKGKWVTDSDYIYPRKRNMEKVEISDE